jgi:hypothetical protein
MICDESNHRAVRTRMLGDIDLDDANCIELHVV